MDALLLDVWGVKSIQPYICNLTGLDCLLLAVSIPRRNERGIALHDMARRMYKSALAAPFRLIFTSVQVAELQLPDVLYVSRGGGE